MQASLNNLLVDSLRSGARGTVKGIVALGMTPMLDVDKVEGDNVSTRTVWGWAHQAPDAGAVQECWEGWLVRKLSTLDSGQAQRMLEDLVRDAITSALASGQSEPLASTWAQTEEFSRLRELAWSRQESLGILFHHLPSLSFRAVPVLQGLFDARLLDRNDLLSRGRAPERVWQQVAHRGLNPLLSWMLHAAKPVPSPLLKEVEQEIWGKLEDSLSRGAASDHLEGFVVRLFSCLNAVASAGLVTPLGCTPKGLVSQVARIEESPGGWPEEVISAMASWKMLRDLPAPSPARSPGARF